VLAYLSRYTHRVAISNSRLIRFDEYSVTFRVKDYRVKGAGRRMTMTLATNEFICRFLIHVLPKRQHRIRHYGFYGNGNRAANIARIRQLLGANISDQGRADDNRPDNTDEPPRVLALPCPCCGGQLIIINTIAPAQHPRARPCCREADVFCAFARYPCNARTFTSPSTLAFIANAAACDPDRVV
jgi:hypothetical protein